MTETEFSMVSEWMSNGNINEFVAAHRDANRFELVRPPFELLCPSPVANSCEVPTAWRRRKGLDLYARPGHDPWRSQGSTSSKVASRTFP